MSWDSPLLRVYEPAECGDDGYPFYWHRAPLWAPGAEELLPGLRDRPGLGLLPVAAGVKDLIRELAGDRCVRCGHPYVKQSSGVWVEEPIDETLVGSKLVNQGRLFDDLPPEIPEQAGLATGDRLGKTKRVLYSPCDERCDHGGPVALLFRNDDGTGAPTWGAVQMEAVAGDPKRNAGALSRNGGLHAAWRILTVHHLNGVKHDLRWGNLVSLCQRCHLHIQGKVVMEQPFMGEHTSWFRPHAAWWYAHKYEGRSITRAEALERMDELLAYERRV